jgi:phosphocarrier protein
MRTKDVVVVSEQGLHAKPADLFVRAANGFSSIIRIMNLTRQTPYENAKSILKVLSLGIYRNHQVRIQAEGIDEKEAVDALSHLIESDFAAEEINQI